MKRPSQHDSYLGKCYGEKHRFYNTLEFKEYAKHLTGLVTFYLAVLALAIYSNTGEDLTNELFQIMVAGTLAALGLNDAARTISAFEKIKGIVVAALSMLLLIVPIADLFG